MKKITSLIRNDADGYQWTFAQVGGVPRIKIDSGEDIRHLGELDQKLWTVLSCPVSGLEMDEETLRMMDYDKDGKIRVPEVVQTAEWLCSVLRDPDLLLRGENSLRLADINRTTEEGEKLYNTACRILDGLGRPAADDNTVISIDDTADSKKIFAQTLFNGDGVIIPESTDDILLKQVIEEVMKQIGSVEDRSGKMGVNLDQIKEFYAEAAAYKAWMDEARAGGYDSMASTYDAFMAVRDKVDDHFKRCELLRFAPEAKEKLDVTVEGVEGTDKLPLGRVNEECVLELDNVNPDWKSRIAGFFGDKNRISQAEWLEIRGSYDAYTAWIGKKAGTKVEPLGYDRISEIMEHNGMEALEAIVKEDLALQSEADSIGDVDRLLHFCRDFYQLLRNFVTFSDFYDRDSKAIFQAGQLYIDQRCCDLCVIVTDMAAQEANSIFSGMFLIYCTCKSKKLNKSMNIVAALTMGDVQNIRVGKNALFYDCNGNDWDAVVTKVVDNPISIRQAFYTPYRKMANFIDETISKFATSKNEKVMDNATSQIATAGDRVESVASEAASKQMTPAEQAKEKRKAEAFDIAKFCGIFAAIGMALGYIGGFIISCVTGFMKLNWWQMPLAIVGLMLVISGPSMLLAWIKLRKRNLSPILNANGWAINSRVIINIMFGATLTSMAQIPRLNLDELRKNDPFMKKGAPTWQIVLWCIGVVVVAATVVCGILLFLGKIRWPF